MVVLNPAVPRGPQCLSSALLVSCEHRYSSITRIWRKQYPTHKIRMPNSLFCLYPPLSPFSPHSCIKRLKISARLGRPTNRRNSLRKKLTEKQQNQTLQLNEASSGPAAGYGNGVINYPNLVKENVETSVVNSDSEVNEVIGSVDVLKSQCLGDSVLREKLESWFDRYKADSELWGIGSNPIFTVFQTPEGRVESVTVDEVEILKRNGIEPSLFVRNKLDEDLAEVNSKILHSKFVAREMESGNYEIPKNSSLAKVVVLDKSTSFVDSIQHFSVKCGLAMNRLPKMGIMVLCGFFVMWAIGGLFISGKDKEYTRLEKEMLRRKMKARKEKKNLMKGNVEVVHDPIEPNLVSTGRPRINKEELLRSINKTKSLSGGLALQVPSRDQAAKLNELDANIMEIRAMARRAREIERGDSFMGDSDGRDELTIEEPSNEIEAVKEDGEKVVDVTNHLSDNYLGKKRDFSEIFMPMLFSPNGLKNVDAISNSESLVDNSVTMANESPEANAFSDSENVIGDVINQEQSDRRDPNQDINTEVITNINQYSNTLEGQVMKAKKSFKKKPMVISSVKEAKEFLTRRSDKQEPHEEHRGIIMPKVGGDLRKEVKNESNGNKMQCLEGANGVIQNTTSNESNVGGKAVPSTNNDNWMENNFQTLEPVIEKIGAGFRDNYTVASEKVKQEFDLNTSTNYPKLDGDDGELDWMRDDRLREIVFQVRDNELAGRDPFYMMDEEDKLTFYGGLEREVEKENTKLSVLHEWLHSNIENLDYGADGMSVYDPPEKIIPRWKGPTLNKNPNPEFLNNFVEQRKALVKGNISSPGNKNGLDLSKNENVLSKPAVTGKNKRSPGTVIEGSDGSVRAGKKSGKEFWQHTKKWSQGFLESYNAESDPEIKAVMKDIGKDLDRWLTEKEIQEGADLINKVPKREKEFIKKKLEKVRREMELFGPQAVLSKYREYGDQKEEDYLWWLDLPFILCIELYTNENGEQRIGLYSLEMAQDLELDPKPYHVIAFEDPSDCKNLCYIIQAHMEMLGNGNAFVVAQPPKDAFREARENGFSVTVIRKGELQLNVDQTLEEVEEQISEIGSKIYHDKITSERSVDIDALMKGVFGAGKRSRRRKLGPRLRRRLKRPTKKVKGFG